MEGGRGGEGTEDAFEHFMVYISCPHHPPLRLVVVSGSGRVDEERRGGDSGREDEERRGVDSPRG